MAYGKNKGLAKGGKKGQKRKQQDAFLKKVWYDVKAPTYFQGKGNRKVGKTVVSKTQGTKIETEGLKGRICEFNLADLKEDEMGKSEDGHKKIKLEIQEIQGKNCLTDFHAMSLTRDKISAMIKKKHSLIEARADCRTADGYTVRLFCLAFTKEVKDFQVKQFTYAQTGQVRRIRKKMVQVLQQEVAQGNLKNLVQGLVVDKLESAIKHATSRIYPLDPIHIHKVKIVKKPKLDITKLMEVHEKDDGVAVNESEEAKNLLTQAEGK